MKVQKRNKYNDAWSKKTQLDKSKNRFPTRYTHRLQLTQTIAFTYMKYSHTNKSNTGKREKTIRSIFQHCWKKIWRRRCMQNIFTSICSVLLYEGIFRKYIIRSNAFFRFDVFFFSLTRSLPLCLSLMHFINTMIIGFSIEGNRATGIWERKSR